MELIIRIINPRDLKIRKKEKTKGQTGESGGTSVCHGHSSLVMIIICNDNDNDDILLKSNSDDACVGSLLD